MREITITSIPATTNEAGRVARVNLTEASGHQALVEALVYLGDREIAVMVETSEASADTIGNVPLVDACDIGDFFTREEAIVWGVNAIHH
jgi:hypothetical protein